MNTYDIAQICHEANRAYCMVLLVLPRPSRYDKINDRILAGPAEELVQQCLPEYKPIYAHDFNHLMMRDYGPGVPG